MCSDYINAVSMPSAVLLLTLETRDAHHLKGKGRTSLAKGGPRAHKDRTAYACGISQVGAENPAVPSLRSRARARVGSTSVWHRACSLNVPVRFKEATSWNVTTVSLRL